LRFTFTVCAEKKRKMVSKLSLLVFCLFMAHAYGQLSFEDLISHVFTNATPIESTTGKVFQPEPPTTPTTPNRVGETGRYKSCGVERECVPRHLCADGTISTTGENFIDIRINSNEVCTYNEVCCDIPNKTTTPVIDPFPKERHEGCGWRNEEGVGYKITGDTDNEAQFGEFPWMVAILKTEDAGGDIIHLYDCGGSLIAPNVVLTASHCVINRKAQELIVRGGEWDTQNTNEILNHVDKPVREIITHEKYNKGALYNDVALLILEEPFVWQ
ncbi:hypothetical protein DOY81_015501, partial [Sarcophaga bullata]